MSGELKMNAGPGRGFGGLGGGAGGTLTRPSLLPVLGGAAQADEPALHGACFGVGVFFENTGGKGFLAFALAAFGRLFVFLGFALGLLAGVVFFVGVVVLLVGIVFRVALVFVVRVGFAVVALWVVAFILVLVLVLVAFILIFLLLVVFVFLFGFFFFLFELIEQFAGLVEIERGVFVVRIDLKGRLVVGDGVLKRGDGGGEIGNDEGFRGVGLSGLCLLYTSDAADEYQRVVI